jgi:Asp-tRNA(Asn)/Glu-tRNA(Gln) amidotransferase A subunit family amidase
VARNRHADRPASDGDANRHDERGLPIGMQIVGGFLEDKMTLKFAELIEREFNGFRPPPNHKT